MTNNQVAGCAVLSLLPIGWTALSILTVGLWGTLLVVGGIAGIVGVIFVGTGFLANWGK